MNVFRSISLATRKLSILITIIVLVALSLFLYYAKYIPANKERLQHQGFLILRQQQDGIQQSLQDLRNYFTAQRQWLVKKISNNTDTFYYKEYRDRPLNYSFTGKKLNDRQPKDVEPESCKPREIFDQDTLTFEFNSTWESIVFKVSLDQLFGKVLELGKAHFFHYHFIICKQHERTPGTDFIAKDSVRKKNVFEENGHLVYSSSGLAASEQFQTDSLGSLLTSPHFSKIITLEMNGSPFKAFMLPFQLEQSSLILTGLMPDNEYRRRLQSIPFNTVNLIVIIFLVILISLPYIKVFFISPQEHFGIRDLVLLGVTLFAGTAFLLIILQQIYMQTGARMRVREKLYSLSNSINSRFRQDISNAYHEIRYLDTALARAVEEDTDSTDRGKVPSILIKASGGGKEYEVPFDTSNHRFLTYSLVQWANDSGRQRYKWLLSGRYSFSNIGYRQYFKDVKAGRLYSFASSPIDSPSSERVDSFSIQPVYSMSTGLFEVNIAIPSRVLVDSMKQVRADTMKMAGLSATMQSVMNTVLPRGYGFYIIDNKGLIQFQSEGTVTLRENFLEWISDNQNLGNTIRNRQSRFVADQYIDDRQFSLYLRPVDQLPLHLVVFHCNDFTTTSILHINGFTLFFLFVLLCMLLVFCFFAWNKTNHFSWLAKPIYQYSWIIPGKNKSSFFTNANCYLLVYMLITGVTAIAVHRYSTVWFIGLISPLFVVWTLYLLFRLHVHLNNKLPKEILKNAFKLLIQPYNLIALTFLGLLNIIYFKMGTNLFGGVALVGWEALSVLVMALAVGYFPQISETLFKGKVGRFLSNFMDHTAFWLLSVIAISILPVTSFFVYAHQKEINLLIKANQLDMAQRIENRLDSNYNWLNDVASRRKLSKEDVCPILYMEGIYDEGCVNAEKGIRPIPGRIPSEPYDKVIKSIRWKYRSLDRVLPGQDIASDEKWYRDDRSGHHNRTMKLIYKLSAENKKDTTISDINSLEVTCDSPSIFSYNKMSSAGSLIIIGSISLVLLILFYRLLRTITGRLFHSWNFKGEETIDVDKSNVVRKWANNNGFEGHGGIDRVLKTLGDNNSRFEGFSIADRLLKPLLGKQDDKYKELKEIWKNEYIHRERDRTNVVGLEDNILYIQYHLTPLYQSLWKECNSEEKYFLFDMARDGFVNYKRAGLVQQLLFKGMLMKDDNEELKIMSVSFRNFILEKGNTEELAKLKEEFHVQGTWSKLRTPVLIGITAVGTFLFITQQDFLQRMAALVPTLSAIFGLGSLILGSKGKSGAA